jgi:hypothetical protein
MISDWYFCYSIGASSAATFSLLSIFDTLSLTDDDPSLRYVAIQELRKMDYWSQIYAVPAVLAGRQRTAGSKHFDSALSPYFSELMALLPEESVDSIVRLFEIALFESSSGSAVAVALETSSTTCFHPQEADRTPTPYLELKEYMAQAMILAVALDAAGSSADSNVEISRLMDREGSAFAQIFRRALNHEFGRFAFTLAVRFGLKTKSEVSDTELLTKIWSDPFRSVCFEPDLLRLTAEILFLPSAAHDSGGSLEAVHTEIQTLSNIRKLKGRKRFNAKVLDRIGPGTDADLISLICWQNVLLEISVRLDPAATAEFIGKFWAPAEEVNGTTISVRSAFGVAETTAWTQQLARLSGIHGGRIRIETDSYEVSEFSDKNSWVFLSPWVRHVRPEWSGPVRQEKNNYPGASGAAPLLRLCVAVHVAAEVLQAAAVTGAAKSSAAAFLAHAHKVFGWYKGWLRNYDSGPNEMGAFPLPLTGLALFAQRQVDNFGKGLIKAVSPLTFAELLDLKSVTGADPAAGKLPEQERRFLGTLPSILFDWVMEAYAAAVEPGKTARWLDPALLDKLYASFKAGGTLDKIPGLVMRFLGKVPPDWKGYIDWRKKGQWTARSHRELLLTRPDLTWEDWNTGWDEPDDPARQIVLAVERVSSLGRGPKPPADLSDKWKVQLAECLRSVDHRSGLDRLTGLRLTELVGEPIVDNETELLELICYVILEFRSEFDIYRLFEKIYSFTDDEIPLARKEVQKTLVSALLQKREVDVEDARFARQARDPRTAFGTKQKADLIDEMIARLAFQGSNKTGLARSLCSRIHDLRTARLQQLERNGTIRSVAAGVQTVGAKQEIASDGHGEIPASWKVKAIVNDPNGAEAHLFYSEIDTGDLENLFEDPKAFEAWDLGSVHMVVARIISAPGRGRDDEYILDCGLSSLFALQAASGLQPIGVGDFVSLPIAKRRSERTNKDFAHISKKDAGKISVLPCQPRPGDVCKLSVLEEPDKRNRSRNTRTVRYLNRRIRLDERNKQLWDADLSRRFQRLPDCLESFVYARLYGENNWIPLDGELVDLLGSIPDGRSVPLVFIEATMSNFGVEGWRFAVSPGRNFVIRKDQFLIADAIELEKRLTTVSNSEGPYGLIIAVEPAKENGKIRLRLSDSPIAPEYERYLPDLSRPFDFRNIEWRDLFAGDKSFTAQRKDGGWFYCLPVEIAAGYALREIQVDWKNHDPEFGETTSEFVSPGWSGTFEEGRVEGIRPYQLRLDLKNLKSHEIDEFVSKMLSLMTGTRFELKEAISPVKSEYGSVDCLTKEGLRVRVALGSISMRPMPVNRAPDIGVGRLMEVSYLPSGSTCLLKVDERSIREMPMTGDTISGIFVRVPPKAQNCRIIWKTRERPITQDAFRVTNLDRFPEIKPGCKVFGTLANDTWTFTAEPAVIRGRALWQAEDAGRELDDASVYAGEIFGTRKHLVETRPGRFVLLERRPAGISGSIESYTADGGHSRKIMVTHSTGGRPSWIVLSNGKEILCGVTPQELSGEVEIRNSALKLTVVESNQYKLERKFELRKPELRQSRSREDIRAAETLELKRRIDEYLNARPPTPLFGTFRNIGSTSSVLLEPTGAVARIPSGVEGSWQNWVEVPAEERTYVVGGLYAPDKTAIILYESFGGYRASFRKVPPRDLGKFIEALPRNDEGRIVLDFALYFVGRELTDPESGESFAESHFRLEFGYGHTVLVPESRLRLDGHPVGKAGFVLFQGDLIREIEIIDGAILDIVRVSVGVSQGSRLYAQKSRDQIIHLINAVNDQGVVRIRSVEAFADNSPDHAPDIFNKIEARLDADSEKFLRERHKKTIGEFVFLGRLNDAKFLDTLGEEIVYEHVTLTFRNDAPISSLTNGERLFMRTDGARSENNEVSLSLRPHQKIRSDDIGTDFVGSNKQSRVRLKRREFSVREDLLGRLLENGRATDFLTDQLVLVRLGLRGSSILADMRTGAPLRNERVLESVIRAPGDSELAAIDERKRGIEGKNVNLRVLELSPGIYVPLARASISAPRDLVEGTIVTVERKEPVTGGRPHFIVTEAAPSQKRYFQNNPRAAVALPKNNLRNKRVIAQRRWSDEGAAPSERPDLWSRDFSIGDFPNVEPVAAQFHKKSGRWTGANPREMMRMMRTPHPKFILVGSRSGVEYFEPLTDGALPVGRISYNAGGREAYFESLLVDNADSVRLKWQYLTYRQESINAVANVVGSHSWNYHDKTSVYLDARGAPIDERLSSHNARSGPLFFEDRGDGDLRLRYDSRNLLRFGLPVGLLLEFLESRKNATPSPLAGFSEAGGLWIEIVPGRVVELPESLVFARRDGASPLPLRGLYWEAFAAGDIIKIRKYPTAALSIDQIELEDWQPSARGLLGTGTAILPVLSSDPDTGALELGTDSCRFTLPVDVPGNIPPLVILDDQNNISSFDRENNDGLPRFDTVVLIGQKRDRGFEIRGLEGVIARPDSAWQPGDDIDEWLLPNLRSNVDPVRLQNLITLIGGVLPVTVEGVDRPNRVVYFSRRRQINKTGIGKNGIALTHVVGLLDEAEVLLRCGSTYFVVAPNLIVSGVPPDVLKDVVDYLVSSRARIWLHRSDEGHLQGGLRPEADDQILVSFVKLIKGTNDVRISGALCRAAESQKIYWLPEAEAAWTRIRHDQLEEIFESQERFKVRLMVRDSKNSRVSIVRVRATEREYDRLGVGSELVVRIVGELRGRGEPQKMVYAAETLRSKVVLCLEAAAGEMLEIGLVLTTEVISRSSGGEKSLRVCPFGKRPYRLELPGWLRQPLNIDGVRAQMNSFAEHDERLDDLAATGIDKATVPELTAMLHQVYSAESKGLGADEYQLRVKIARAWRKKHQDGAEIRLDCALMVALILNDAGARPFKHLQQFSKSFKDEASAVINAAAAAAIRSYHVEILTFDWLFNEEIINDLKSGLWKRLSSLTGLIGCNVDNYAKDRIDNFCYAVGLRSQTHELRSISNSLLAATGNLPDIHQILARSARYGILSKLVAIYPPGLENRGAGTRWLQPLQISELEELLARIIDDRVESTLLSPIFYGRASRP